MNVCYVSDSKYAPITVVSMLSMLSHYKNTVDIYYLDTGLTGEDKVRLREAVKEPNSITFYDCRELLLDLEKMGFPRFLGNYSSYARLLMGEVLPAGIDKILYLDSDTIILDSLDEMYNSFGVNDESGETIKLCEGVQDLIPNEYYMSVGIDGEHKYINSGVLLIDLECWRREFNMTNINNIAGRYKKSHYPDQDIINGRKWDMYKNQNGAGIGLRYNLTTPYLEWDYKYLSKIFPSLNDIIYTREDIRRAISRPAIVHLVDGLRERPWIEGSSSPFYKNWWTFLNQTEFRKDFLGFKPEGSKKHVIMKMIYKYAPQILSSSVYTWNIQRIKNNRK
jgi:lipopolysaccharide biosynthesis glycosyltransferase